MRRVSSFVLVSVVLLSSTSAHADMPASAEGAPDFYSRRADAAGGHGAGGIRPSLFTGSAETSIPIEVPAGVVTPGLALSYSSRADRGAAGFGWSLESGARITRSTKYGHYLSKAWTPQTARYEFGGDELIRTETTIRNHPFACPAKRYYSEVDRALLILFCESGNYWTVTSKDGTVRVFGRDSDARLGTTNTAEWLQDELISSHGARWKAEYSTHDGSPRFDGVKWALNASYLPIGPQREIVINWETRPDPIVEYRYGVRRILRHRIANVQVKLGTAQVRRYVLGYQLSAGSEASLLNSVREFGSDDLTALPATTFTYLENARPGFEATPAATFANTRLLSQEASGMQVQELADLDGDGYLDHINATTTNATNNWWMVSKGRGLAGFDAATPWRVIDIPPRHVETVGQYVASRPALVHDLIDMTGDGLPDVFGSDQAGSLFLFRNNGTGFDAAVEWFLPSGAYAPDHLRDGFRTMANPLTYVHTTTELVDVTGDGCPDRLIATTNAGWQLSRNLACDPVPQYQFSTTVAFTWTSTAAQPSHLTRTRGSVQMVGNDDPPIIPQYYGPATVLDGFAEVNGDGLVDYILNGVVHFGTGSGFIQESDSLNGSAGLTAFSSTGSGTVSETNRAGLHRSLLDISGDGRADFVVSNSDVAYWDCKETWEPGDPPCSYTSSTDFSVRMNTGDRMAVANTWLAKRADAANVAMGYLEGSDQGYPDQAVDFGHAKLADVDGSGTVDFIQADNGTWRYYLGAPTKPDLLIRVANGIGGTTDLSWATTNGAKDLGNLHYPVPVVSQVDVRDGLFTVGGNNSSLYRTTFSYSGSYFDRARREMTGFEKVTVTRSDNMGSVPSRSEHFFSSGRADHVLGIPLGRTAAGIECSELWVDERSLAGMTIGVRRGPTTGPFQNRSESWSPWDAVIRTGMPAGSKAPELRRTRAVDRHPTTGATKLRTSRTVYDAVGNVTWLHAEGEGVALADCSVNPSVGADESSVWIPTYAQDTAKWIFTPAETKLCADTTCSQVLKQRKLFFDADDFGNNTLGQILDGDLTRDETWVSFPGETATWTNRNFSHDDWGNVLQATNEIGDQTMFTYTPSKTYLASSSVTVTRNKTQALTLTSTTEWDEGRGTATRSIDPNLRAIRRELDVLGRVVAVFSTPPSDPTGPEVQLSETSYTLGGTGGTNTGNVVQHTSFASETDLLPSWTYLDGFGRVVQSKSPGEAGQFITRHARRTYHGSADVDVLPFFTASSAYTHLSLNESLPTHSIRQTDFDWAGRSIEAELRHPSGQVFTTWSSAYSLWESTVTDPRAFTKTYRRDAAGRLVYVREGSGVTAETNYVFDRAGNLVTITDANANVTRIEYDSRGLKREVEDPNRNNCQNPANCPTKFFYNAAGFLTAKVDAKAQRTEYSFDELGRLFKKDYISPEHADSFFTHDQGLNAKGRLTGESRSAHALSVQYDNWGQVTNLQQFSESLSYTLSKTYDRVGRAVTVQYPTGETATYDYGPHGAPTSLDLDAFGTIVQSATYDARMRRIQTVFGNNAVSYVGFGADERPDTMSVTVNGVARMDLQHVWDANGNLASVENTVDGWYREYSYDWADRLTWGQHSVSGTPQKEWSYQYDKTGNLTYNKDWDGDGLDGSYEYGVGAGPAAVTRIGGSSSSYFLTYDLNGALFQETTGGEFHYDFEGRVVKAVGAQTSAAFTYDAGGERRVSKQYHDDATNEDRIVRYLGNYFEEERRSNGSIVSADRYLMFDGERVAEVSDENGLLFFHGDHLGSVSLVTNDQGGVVQRRTYAPFGNPWDLDPAPALTRYGFTGAEEDTDIGQIHLGIRELHFAIGRWISPDPIIPDLADPQSLNPYSYALNNPVRFRDHSGFEAEIPVVAYEITITADRIVAEEVKPAPDEEMTVCADDEPPSLWSEESGSWGGDPEGSGAGGIVGPGNWKWIKGPRAGGGNGSGGTSKGVRTLVERGAKTVPKVAKGVATGIATVGIGWASLGVVVGGAVIVGPTLGEGSAPDADDPQPAPVPTPPSTTCVIECLYGEKGGRIEGVEETIVIPNSNSRECYYKADSRGRYHNSISPWCHYTCVWIVQ